MKNFNTGKNRNEISPKDIDEKLQNSDIQGNENKSAEELNILNKIKQILKSLFSEMKNFRKPKVYRLRGYTTISRVDKKIRAEQNQRLLRNVLVAAIFALILAILLIIFNPFRDLREILRMIGL